MGREKSVWDMSGEINFSPKFFAFSILRIVFSFLTTTCERRDFWHQATATTTTTTTTTAASQQNLLLCRLILAFSVRK